jgi:hypothetical protein
LHACRSLIRESHEDSSVQGSGSLGTQLPIDNEAFAKLVTERKVNDRTIEDQIFRAFAVGH